MPATRGAAILRAMPCHQPPAITSVPAADAGTALPAALLARHARPVPRYTSYPSAAHFGALADDAHRGWLQAVPADEPVSLYLHIPYCASLCWYCGCNTQATVHHRARIAAYVEVLLREIEQVAALLGRRQPVAAVHFGGGTPNLMSQAELDRVMVRLEQRFEVLPGAERAIEIDPRHLTAEFALALGASGFNRASIGVQDFDPGVQRHIHRLQPYPLVEQALSWLRVAGIPRVSFDLIHGLPGQTVETVRDTVRLALALAPDRIALFGYAHLPARQKHQRLLDPDALPAAAEREAMQRAAHADLLAGGRVAVGMDHFARPGDPLLLHCTRNFQGYSSDPAGTLLGFGASAISRFREGHAQHHAATPDWRAAVEAGRLATARGIAVDGDDRARGEVIEALMCRFEAPLDAIAEAAGVRADALVADPAVLDGLLADGLAWRRDGRVGCSPAGRALVRNLCAAFDRHAIDASRHAPAV